MGDERKGWMKKELKENCKKPIRKEENGQMGIHSLTNIQLTEMYQT